MRRGAAFAVALGLHLAVAALLALWGHFSPAPRPVPRPPRQAVSLRTISDAQWRAVQQAGARAAAATAAKKPAPVKREAPPKGQVVDVAQGNGQTSPDAKYLAESANRVAKETRAKETSAQYDHAMARTSSAVPQALVQHERVQVAHRRGNGGRGDDDAPRREAVAPSPPVEAPASPRHRDALARRDPKAPGISASSLLDRQDAFGNRDLLQLAPQARAEATEAQEGSEGRAGTDSETTTASPAERAAQSGAAANDHLDNVAEGDGTFLNTREWKFAGFFNRVKQCVSGHWDPVRVVQRHNLSFTDTKYTVLAVVLNEQGVLKEVHVARSSGLEALDEEAVAAFERSQPFPNPPRALLGDDATIRFQFGFYMESGGGTQFRPFRGGL